MSVASPPTPRSAAGPLVGAKVTAAQSVMLWERIAPALLLGLAPIVVVLILGQFGLFERTGAAVHWAILVLAFVGTVFGVGTALRFLRPPGRSAARVRVEEDGHLAHDPLTSLHDAPSDPDDKVAAALWQRHQQEMAERARLVKLKGPRASADRVDPHGLRYACVGLLVIAAVTAGRDAPYRLFHTFNPDAVFVGDPALVDIWIEPPDYTGRAPQYLVRAGNVQSRENGPLRLPVGSTLLAQGPASGRGVKIRYRVADESRLKPVIDPEIIGRQQLEIAESGVLSIRNGAQEGQWQILAEADALPTVAWEETPSRTDDGYLALAFDVSDDYGIARTELFLQIEPTQSRGLDMPRFDEKSLEEVRSYSIQGANGPSGNRTFDLDVEADPWAGLEVIGFIKVVDGAGQSAQTEAVTFTLPERAFYNPLAKAVVEQRQTLATARDKWRTVEWALSALTLAPDRFYDSAKDYLLIRSAMWKVMKDDKTDFTGTVDDFWPLALQLEDQALELARQRLEAAKEALRQALENGASDEELSQLTEELRAAMEQYIQALAQSGTSRPGEASVQGPGETLGMEDLNAMLDSVRDLAEAGAQGAARQALNDLEAILENLQLGQSGGGMPGNQGGQPGGEDGGEGQQGAGGMAGQAADLIGRQRGLANETYDRSRSGQTANDDLADAEGSLADDLDALLQELDGQGTDENGGASAEQGRRSLEGASRSMSRAQEALRNGDTAGAGNLMEQAIDQLRDGAGALAEAQRQAQGQGEDGQQGDGRQEGGGRLDPLGRPVAEGNGDGVEVPGISDAARARQVLEELRRRLSEGERTEEEIEYLERLLERF